MCGSTRSMRRRLFAWPRPGKEKKVTFSIRGMADLTRTGISELPDTGNNRKAGERGSGTILTHRSRVFNIPPNVHELKEGAGAKSSPDLSAGAVLGLTDFGFSE